MRTLTPAMQRAAERITAALNILEEASLCAQEGDAFQMREQVKLAEHELYMAVTESKAGR